MITFHWKTADVKPLKHLGVSLLQITICLSFTGCIHLEHYGESAFALFPTLALLPLLTESTVWQCSPKRACLIQVENILFLIVLYDFWPFHEVIVPPLTSPDSPHIVALFTL